MRSDYGPTSCLPSFSSCGDVIWRPPAHCRRDGQGNMQNNLDRRVAIVTGGADGIGFAIAQRLARAGAHLAIADVNPLTASQAAGALAGEGLRAIPVGVDVADEHAVAAMMDSVHRELGPVEILVNN